ncbi:MAG: hypothetical protein WA843_01370 [Candidatus Saccharimonadales bacterium]
MKITDDERKRAIELRDRMIDSMGETDATVVIYGVCAFLVNFIISAPKERRGDVRKAFQCAIEP